MENQDLSYDAALEELVAESCQKFLVDGNAFQMIQKLAKQDKSLVAKLTQGIKDLGDRLRKAYNGHEAQGKESRITSQMIDTLDQLHAMWTKALEDATLNYRAAQGTVSDTGTKNQIVHDVKNETTGEIYPSAVLLDTTFFDGIKPRNWATKLKTYVENRSEKSTFIMPIVDENGEEQMLQFAKKTDEIKVNDRTRKVLNELVYTKDNISKLAVIHIDEIVEVSEESNPYYSDGNKENWLDERGWLHRNAYVINSRNGKIYNLTLDIAKTKDGRTILYATKGKINMVGTTIGSSAETDHPKSKSDHADKVPQLSEKVNTKFSETENLRDQVSAEDDARYLELAKDPERNKAELQRMVDDAANKAGYDSPKLYHGTTKYGFTVFSNEFSDDKLSFFVTESADMAQTYSGKKGVQRIGDVRIKDLGKLSGEEIQNIYDTFVDIYGQEKPRFISADDEAGRAKLVTDAVETFLSYPKITKYIDDLNAAGVYDKAYFQDRFNAFKNDPNFLTAEQLYHAVEGIYAATQYAYYVDNPGDILSDLRGSVLSPIALFNDSIAKKSGVMAYQVSGMLTGKKFYYCVDLPTFINFTARPALQKGNYALVGRPGKQLIIDAKGSRWDAISVDDYLDSPFGEAIKADFGEDYFDYNKQTVNTRQISEYAYKGGYDSVLIKNVYDNGEKGVDAEKGNVQIYYKPSDLKSADPVTYDDAGDVIPLSERFNEKTGDIRYQDSFEEDKYFARKMDQWEILDDHSYIKVGNIGEGSALNLVGLPTGRLFFDVSKIKAEMQNHSDHLSPDVMKKIPALLANPIVITEYKPGEGTNTVNVYGKLYANDKAVTVGVVATLDRGGSVISKIRTVHARGNLQSQITDGSTLYLNENKKETNKWFQAQGQRVPMRGTKYGLIRSITLTDNLVKTRSQDYVEEDEESPRTLLSGALLSVAKTEEDRKTLETYQQIMKSLDGNQRVLERVRGEIFDISFSPGKRDMARLAMLKESAAKENVLEFSAPFC